AGREELGLYALGFSVLLLVVCAQESLITTPYTVLGHRVRARRRSVRATSALVQHGAFVLACPLGGIVGWIACRAAGERRMAWIALAVSVGIAGTLMREFARRVAFAHLRFGVATAIDGAFAALMLGGLWLA